MCSTCLSQFHLRKFKPHKTNAVSFVWEVAGTIAVGFLLVLAR